MNSEGVRFELDERRRNIKNISDEQAMALGRAYNDLYEDDSIMFLRDIGAQLYYSTVDIYGLPPK